jgi:hypothetical protein
VSKYPELEALSWKWHDENYSMGRGYYLESDIAGEMPHPYREGETVTYRFSVRVDKYAGGKGHHLYKHYTGIAFAPAYPDEGEKAKVRLNAEHNGVEVSFPSKPDDAVISSLRAAGFRWHRFKKLWYARQSERTIALANELAAQAA